MKIKIGKETFELDVAKAKLAGALKNTYVYKFGQHYRDISRYGKNAEYVLSRIQTDTGVIAALVDVNSGEAYGNGHAVDAVCEGNISEIEWEQVTCGDINDFEIVR